MFLFAPREFKFRFVLSHTKNEAEANELLDTVDRDRKHVCETLLSAWSGRIAPRITPCSTLRWATIWSSPRSSI